MANWLNGFIAIDWAEHGLYKNNKESAAIKYFAWTPNAERWSITAIITSNRQRSFCIEKDMIEANFTNSTEKRFLFIYWGHRGCARFSHGRPIVLSLSIAIYLFFIIFRLLFILTFVSAHCPEPGPKRNPINLSERGIWICCHRLISSVMQFRLDALVRDINSFSRQFEQRNNSGKMA